MIYIQGSHESTAYPLLTSESDSYSYKGRVCCVCGVYVTQLNSFSVTYWQTVEVAFLSQKR